MLSQLWRLAHHICDKTRGELLLLLVDEASQLVLQALRLLLLQDLLGLGLGQANRILLVVEFHGRLQMPLLRLHPVHVVLAADGGLLKLALLWTIVGMDKRMLVAARWVLLEELPAKESIFVLERFEWDRFFISLLQGCLTVDLLVILFGVVAELLFVVIRADYLIESISIVLLLDRIGSSRVHYYPIFRK